MLLLQRASFWSVVAIALLASSQTRHGFWDGVHMCVDETKHDIQNRLIEKNEFKIQAILRRR